MSCCGWRGGEKSLESKEEDSEEEKKLPISVSLQGPGALAGEIFSSSAAVREPPDEPAVSLFFPPKSQGNIQPLTLPSPKPPRPHYSPPFLPKR